MVMTTDRRRPSAQARHHSSNVSQHLAILRGRLLVTTRRDGNNVWYSVEEPRVYEILDAARAILENQLGGSAC